MDSRTDKQPLSNSDSEKTHTPTPSTMVSYTTATPQIPPPNNIAWNMMFLDQALAVYAKNLNYLDELANTNKDDLNYQNWIAAIKTAQASCKVYVWTEKRNNLTYDHMRPLIGIYREGTNEFFKQNYPSYKNKIDEEVIKELDKRKIFSPQYNEPNISQLRHNSKFRVIYSNVPFKSADGSIKMVPVITACGINLMGSSPEDYAHYTNNGVLNKKTFSADIKKLAYLILSAAKENNLGSNKKDPFTIADFNCGVYLKNLSEEDKQTAKALVYQAFSEAAKDHQVYVSWCIWKNAQGADQTVSNLNSGVFKNAEFIQANKGELGESAQLNNGSDRTIGGNYSHPDPKTTEEQLAQRSALLLVQSCLNPHMDNALRKPNYCAVIFNQPKCFMGSKGYVQIEFDTVEQAQQLSKTLFSLNSEIFCDYKTKDEKKVYQLDYEDPHKTFGFIKKTTKKYFIPLSEVQYNELMKLLNKHNIVLSNNSAVFPENYEVFAFARITSSLKTMINKFMFYLEKEKNIDKISLANIQKDVDDLSRISHSENMNDLQLKFKEVDFRKLSNSFSGNDLEFLEAFSTIDSILNSPAKASSLVSNQATSVSQVGVFSTNTSNSSTSLVNTNKMSNSSKTPNNKQ